MADNQLRFEWMETFELGVPEIDSDHRALLDLMRAVQSAAAAHNRERCVQYMDRVRAFSRSHFAREEKLLDDWNYPNTERHASYHADLMARADAVAGACAKIEDAAALEDCCREMMSFLIDDVVRGDHRLKSFLQKADLVLPV